MNTKLDFETIDMLSKGITQFAFRSGPVEEMHAKYSQVRETSGLRRNEEIWQSIIGKETFEDIYQDHFLPIKVVKGITYEKKIYSNINVAFGFKDEYYDLEF